MLTSRIEKLSAWLVLASGWQRYLTAFAAGLVSALAMAPFDAFPVLFLTLPVIIWLLDGVHSDARSGIFNQTITVFGVGWWFGFGYFLAGLWWIANALLVESDAFAWAVPLAVIILPAGLAIFWGLAAVFARLFWRENWTRVVIFAVAISGAEYLRGTILTGFPWNTLGYAAMTFPVTMQSSALIGLYGVTLLAVFVFSAPLVAVADKLTGIRSATKPLLFIAIILSAAHVVYGVYRMAQNPTEYVDGVKLRLMQPDIDQAKKFEPDLDGELLATYLETSRGENGLVGISHLLWPESVFPFLLTERSDVLAAIAALLPEGTQLITGAARAEPGTAGDPYGRVYNSVYSINSSGEIIAAADKVHLVPFGEYLPFQKTLEAFGFEQLTRVRGGFEPGAQRYVMDGGKAGSFLPLICYEIIFSGEAMIDRQSDIQPGWIVNVTNDAWYGKTPGPYQHLRQSVIRGVEEGMPVVRVANTGISSVSDAFGRTIAKLGLNQKGALDSSLPKPAVMTNFALNGNLPFFVLLAVGFMLSVTRNIILRD